jgi:hypothetical protein
LAVALLPERPAWTPRLDGGNVGSVGVSRIEPRELERLLATPQEPGVAQAMATFEIVEKAYFEAVSAAPQALLATSYATTTSPR